jgi:AcrR family transcriptional regulator
VPDLDLPTPPWRTPRKARPPRQPLSQDVIVDTAIRILDSEGLDGVSMRRIAQELGTGPASLYAHVANKDELLELMLDRINAEITVPEPDPAHWPEQVKEVARQAYRAFSAHINIALVVLATIPTGPNALRIEERLLAILFAGGVPPQPAAWFIDRLFLYIAADAYQGSLHLARQRASGLEVRIQLRDYYQSLPADRFPNLTGHAEEMMPGGADERFEFGLEMLVNGIAADARATG